MFIFAIAALILAASAWRPSLSVVPGHGLRPALDLVAAPGWQHPEAGGSLPDEGGVLRTWHGEIVKRRVPQRMHLHQFLLTPVA